MKHNILITAIGSFSADCAIRELKKAGNQVFGCDIYPPEWHAVSKDLEKTYQVPLATQKNEYINSLLNISHNNDIQYIIPLTDVEIDILNMNRDVFESKGIILCMPSNDTLAIARDKYAIYKTFIDDSSVPTINTYKTKVDTIPDILPCIAKPFNGRSSEGLMIINNPKDLEGIKNKDNYIIQEFISGPVCTVDYVRNNKTGHDFCIPREELLRTKNGAGTTVRTFYDENLANLVSHIGKTLKINGTVNMEFIKQQDKYFLIDINPRFSAGIAFSVAAGYNMVLNHLNCHTNQNIEDGTTFYCGLITKRYHEEIL